MDYKILINGRNAVLASDIIRHSGENTVCFSTSDVWGDIMVHIKYMKPDAYIVLYPKDDDKDQMISQLMKLADDPLCKEMAFVIVADSDEIEEFEKKAPFFQALMITRPTSAKEIEKRTVEYIRALIRKRIEEEKKQQELEAAARAREEERKALEEYKKQKKEEEKAQKKQAKEQSMAVLFSEPKETPAKAAPANSEPEKGAPEKEPSEGSGERKRILIVDDDRNVLKLLKSTLSEKYDVNAMLNGKMAEKYLETKTADLILLDHEMPVESGLEVFQKIKANKERSDIPVIFLTGTSDTETIKEILSLRPRGYLLKPVDVDKLMTTIADALK